MSSRLLALNAAGTLHTGLISAVLSLVIGMALLWRAYALWRLNRRAWLITLLLVTADIGITSWQLAAGADTWTAWANLALAAVVVIYLLQPGVRDQFQDHREDP